MTTFETEEDKVREQEVAEMIERCWNCKCYKTPQYHAVDRSLERNGIVVAWAEVKVRKVKRFEFQTLLISSSKICAVYLLNQATGLRVFLVVRWTDQTGWIDPLQEKWEIKMGGRTDRWAEVGSEPCCHIPVDKFNIIH